MSIESVKERFEQELLALPNVVGVGIGERDGKPVIKVLVTTKVPVADLDPEEVVPSTLHGQPTDVEEVGTVTAQS